MSITIYQIPHSPFCIPVTSALRALRVPFRVVNIPNSDRSPIIRLTKGAYYQVPLLMDGAKAIYETGPDTQDIAHHIERRFGRGRLFPARLAGQQAIFLRYIENDIESLSFRLTDPPYIRGISDVVARTLVIRHKERKFGRGCVEQWAKQAPQIRQQLEALLLPFDQILQHSPYLFGDAPVYTDFALLGITGNLTYRNYNTLPARLKALRQWEKRIRAFRWPSQ
jgi:glutathione S-transferase